MMHFQIDAPAKINLGLEILGKRSDGYHEIRTVMQTISLVDTIEAQAAPGTVFHSSHHELATADNLILRAIELWSRAVHRPEFQAKVSLTKRIPVAAGLGGASSDAAAMLRLLEACYPASANTADLQEIAAALGSDIPFFLDGPTALASGRGEVLEPLPPLPPCWLVLVTPDLNLKRKTATMYGYLKPDDYSDGMMVGQLAELIRAGAPPENELLENVFERALLRIHPELAAIPAAIRTTGANRVSLTGAGPTWYAMVDDAELATTLSRDLAARFSHCTITIARPRSTQTTVVRI